MIGLITVNTEEESAPNERISVGCILFGVGSRVFFWAFDRGQVKPFRKSASGIFDSGGIFSNRIIRINRFYQE